VAGPMILPGEATCFVHELSLSYELVVLKVIAAAFEIEMISDASS
jgi:hypothetical protein